MSLAEKFEAITRRLWPVSVDAICPLFHDLQALGRSEGAVAAVEALLPHLTTREGVAAAMEILNTAKGECAAIIERAAKATGRVPS